MLISLVWGRSWLQELSPRYIQGILADITNSQSLFYDQLQHFNGEGETNGEKKAWQNMENTYVYGARSTGLPDKCNKVFFCLHS